MFLNVGGGSGGGLGGLLGGLLKSLSDDDGFAAMMGGMDDMDEDEDRRIDDDE